MGATALHSQCEIMIVEDEWGVRCRRVGALRRRVPLSPLISNCARHSWARRTQFAPPRPTRRAHTRDCLLVSLYFRCLFRLPLFVGSIWFQQFPFLQLVLRLEPATAQIFPFPAALFPEPPPYHPPPPLLKEPLASAEVWQLPVEVASHITAGEHVRGGTAPERSSWKKQRAQQRHRVADAQE
ncbi:unnamed protein product [Pleuronectes platessa]|uniref:Uncharacterized protein n=1 Tax=Pleuronectes platessa TaxID=8262 RepID=A0A9N7UGF7_PLEPL|nr:unnamed protein product [Pleuronectes platessa]